MRWIVPIVAAFACFATPVQAQVHRCKDASGKTIYSDAPCTTGQTGQMIERQRTPEEIYQERMQAAEATERKYRALEAERAQQNFELQQRSAAQANAAPAQPQASSRNCAEAQKELEFVSSIRTIPQDEKRLRTNAAIARVNASCGTNTQLMQEPPKVIVAPRRSARPVQITNCDAVFCHDNLGNTYHRAGPDFMTGPNGQACHRSGTFWNCN